MPNYLIQRARPFPVEALLLTAAGLAGFQSQAQAQWFAGASVEALYNDNLARTPLGDQAVGDKSLEVTLWRGLHAQLADYTGLQVQGSISHQQFDHFGSLSNSRIAGSAELSHKFGLGAEVPVLAFTTAIERSVYNDNHRDQTLYRTSLALRQRIHEQWQWSVTAAYEWQNGDYGQYKPHDPPAPPLPSNVWDLHAWQLSFNAEWDLGATDWLGTRLGWRDGDIVASTPPYPQILGASSAVVFDPVFGAGVVAYRLQATTLSLSLDWNHAVGESSTLYLGAEKQWSNSYEDLSYQTSIVRAGFLHNF